MASVVAPENWRGRWLDNASAQTRLGTLTIGERTAVIRGVVVYAIADAGAFGEGRLLRVTGIDTRRDPLGCGPAKRVRYLILQRLPDPADVVLRGLKVTFYGGSGTPDERTLPSDRHVCETHAFRLAPTDHR